MSKILYIICISTSHSSFIMLHDYTNLLELGRFSNRSCGVGLGKIGVGLGVHFLRVGNTSFHSSVQLPAASQDSVEVTLTFKNLGQTDK
jgi:hypothetical protein